MTGGQLRARRDGLGLSQSQLAERLAVSPNTVARWERDEMAIPPYLDLALQTIERTLGRKTTKKRKPDFGEFIRDILEREQETLESVASRARRRGFEISRSAISDIIRGRITNPSLKRIKALSAGLNRPENDILEAAGINVGGTTEGQGEIYISILESPRFTDMASNYERLTDSQKKAAEPMVAQLENWIKSKLPPDKAE